MSMNSPEVASRAETLAELDAVDAVAAMRSGDVRCEEYAAALLERVRASERLNAFRALVFENVLESARAADLARGAGKPLGRLHGLPIPVKDSVNTRDLPTSNGTRALEGFRPTDDAAVLEPLLAEGAFVMGKTNLHELSRSWTCNNGAFGPVLNPYDPTRIPGGSSGGSAAAVAARMAPLAIAEDTLGSIRVPSSLCGVVGFRPTHGRYSNDGIMPLTSDRFDQVGPMARSVSDIVAFDDVLVPNGPPVQSRNLRGLRLGAPESLLASLHPDVERMVVNALAQLTSAGVVIVRADVPPQVMDCMHIARAIIGYENIRSIAAFLREQGIELSFEALIAQASPNIRDLYQVEYTVEGRDQALRDRQAVSAAVARHFTEQRLDALIFPTVLAPALPLGDNPEVELRGQRLPLRMVMARNTALSSCARLPTVTLPAGFAPSGLPVGMDLVAQPEADRALLSIALAVEGLWGRLPAPQLASAARR